MRSVSFHSFLITALLIVVGTGSSVSAAEDQVDIDGAQGSHAAIILRSVGLETSDLILPKKFGLTRNDFQRISLLLEGKGSVVPIRAFQQPVRLGDRSLAVNVTGVTGEFPKTSSLRMVRGRFLTSRDVASRENVVVFDSETARLLLPGDNPIGKAVQIGQQAFVVVGVFERLQLPLAAAKENHRAYIPLTTMRSRFGDLTVDVTDGHITVSNYELSEIRILPDDLSTLRSTAATIKTLLESSHESEDYSLEIPR